MDQLSITSEMVDEMLMFRILRFSFYHECLATLFKLLSGWYTSAATSSALLKG